MQLRKQEGNTLRRNRQLLQWGVVKIHWVITRTMGRIKYTLGPNVQLGPWEGVIKYTFGCKMQIGRQGWGKKQLGERWGYALGRGMQLGQQWWEYIWT